MSIAREHALKSGRRRPHVATVLRCLEEPRGDARRSVERASLCTDAVSTYVAEAYKLDRPGRTRRNPVQTMSYKSRGTLAFIIGFDGGAVPSLEVEALCAVANDGLRGRERRETLIEGLKQRTKEGAAPLGARVSERRSGQGPGCGRLRRSGGVLLQSGVRTVVRFERCHFRA